MSLCEKCYNFHWVGDIKCPCCEGIFCTNSIGSHVYTCDGCFGKACIDEPHEREYCECGVLICDKVHRSLICTNCGKKICHHISANQNKCSNCKLAQLNWK